MIKLMDIGGRKVEYLIKGNGEKTVAIMVGMSCSLYEWLDIVDEISKYARVIVIHRPGVGNSEPHAEGSSTAIASMDLYALIKKLGIEGKIILAGHSYGGICVQHFARLYPEMVEGMVLIESSSMEADKFSELELPESDENQSDEVYLKQWDKYSKCTREQLIEEVKPTLSEKELKFPVEIQKEILELNVRPQFYRTQISELIDLRINVGKIKNAGEFPSIPIKILIRDSKYSLNEMVNEGGIPRVEAEKVEELWQSTSRGLKELSSKSEITIVKNSDHNMNESRPDAVIDAIKELVL